MEQEIEVRGGLQLTIQKLSGKGTAILRLDLQGNNALILNAIYNSPSFGADYYDLTIKFSEHYFDEIKLIDFYNSIGEKALSLNPESSIVLHELVHSTAKQVYKKLFVESRILRLLLMFCPCEEKTQDCLGCKFLNKPVEKEKILEAREILLKRIQSPPTISELALQIGINECYLKKGFKELYGTTVFDFIQEQRFQKAHFLLSTSGLTISAVAEELGYSSLASFSTAFKKYMGILPSDITRK